MIKGKRFLTLSCAITLFAVLIMAILYLFSPQIASWYISSQLKKAGVDAQIEFARPSLNQLSLEKLVITQSNGPLKRLEIEQLVVNFNWLELITKQQVSQVNIQRLSVELALSATDSNSTAERLNLFDFFPSQIFPDIPLAQLNIEQLETSISTLPGVAMLSGALNYRQRQISANFSYSEISQQSERRFAKIKLSVAADNKFSLAIAQAEQFNYQLQGVLSQQKGRVAIKAAQQLAIANYSLLQSFWLQPLQSSELPSLLAQSNLLIKDEVALSASATFGKVDTWLPTVRAAQTLIVNADIGGALSSLAPSGINAADASIAISVHNSWQDGVLKSVSAAQSRLEVSQFEVENHTTEQLSFILDSPLSLTFDSVNNNFSIDSFSLLSTAAPWHTPFATIVQDPLKIQITVIDPAALSFSAQLAPSQLSLTPNEALKAILPLSLNQVKVNIAGKLLANSQRVNLEVSPDSSVRFLQLKHDLAANPELKLQLSSPLTITQNGNNVTPQLAPFTLALSAKAWQSKLGQAQHSNIALAFSELNLAPLSAKIDFNLASLVASPTIKEVTQLNIRDILGTLLLDNDKARLTLYKQAVVELQGIKIAPQLSTKKQQVSLVTPITLELALPLSTPSINPLISPFKMRLQGAPISLGGHPLRYKNMAMDVKKITLSPFRIKAKTKLRQLKASPEFADYTLDVFAEHDLTAQQYSSRMKIRSKSPTLEISAKVRASGDMNTVDLDWELLDLAINEHIDKLLNKSNLPLLDKLIINSGQYNQRGKASLRGSTLALNVNHQINGMSAEFEDLSLDNINLTSRTTLDNQVLSQSGRISIERINSAVDIENISANFKADSLLTPEKASIEISQLNATALEGTFTLEKLHTPLLVPRGNGALIFTKLPLNNVLALEQQPSLSGSGTLEGKLPFRFNHDKLWIEKGAIQSSENGYIRYNANAVITATAQQNTGLSIALDVLQNFHYDSLSIVADYQPSGELVLQSSLKGRNPDWQGGQPIAFSINIEENVLQLLKALKFSGELNEKLQRKLQAQQELSN